MNKYCKDCYGKKLSVGDEVIPVMEEALLIGISGKISKIEYREKYDNYYITIVDEEGKTLLENVDAFCYTTQKRFDKMENEEFVFYITFYNKNFSGITVVPLDDDIEIEIPQDTCYATIYATHLVKEYDCAREIEEETIFNFIIGNRVEIISDENEGTYYLLNDENKVSYAIGPNIRTCRNINQLKKYLNLFISIYKEYDLSDVKNDVEYEKNDKLQEFEKKLVYDIKRFI